MIVNSRRCVALGLAFAQIALVLIGQGDAKRLHFATKFESHKTGDGSIKHEESSNSSLPPFFRREHGIQIKYEFKRQEVMKMKVGTNGVKPDVRALQEGMLVVTQDRIFAFEGPQFPKCKSSNGVSMDFSFDPEDPRSCDYDSRDETAYIDTATLYVEKFYATDVQSPTESAADDIDELDALDQQGLICVLLSGCKTGQCDAITETWLLCSYSSKTIANLGALMQNVYCERNQLQDLLGPAIVRAAKDARTPPRVLENSTEVPKAFSPFVLEAHPDSYGQMELSRIEEAFGGRVIPFRPGANSRSGAAFFYSKDKRYMAKRIRDWELETLWSAVKDGGYSYLIQAGSVMNHHYLGFIREDVHPPSCWIVMKTEGLPKSVTNLIESVSDFFMDVKPRPMVSDRMKMTRTAVSLHALKNGRNGPSASWVDSSRGEVKWRELESRIDADFEFLQRNNLVDYSLLMYGSVFMQPNFSQTRKLTKEMQGSDTANCVLDCPASTGNQRRLVDVTDYVDRYENKVPFKDAKYKCCCATMSSWETAVVRSPCVLVNMEAPPQKRWAMDRTGCGNLIKGKWHTYTSEEKNPFLEGRCIVGAGLWSSRGSLKLKGGPMFIDPEQAFEGYTLSFQPVCSIFCVSVLDYLLPLNLRNTIENLLLAPWYQQRKWSGYGAKMKSLLRCLAAAPLGQGDGATSAINGKLREMIYENSNLLTGEDVADMEEQYAHDKNNGTNQDSPVVRVPSELEENADELESAAKCEDIKEIFGNYYFSQQLIDVMLTHLYPIESSDSQ